MGTELGTGPFWSADSRSLGFFADGKLKRIDLAGSVIRTLANAPIGAGGTWNRDGVIVFAASAIGPLFRVSASGGDAVAMTRLQPGQTGHRFPHFLPDSRHFLFFARGTSGLNGVYVGSLDDAAPRRLVEADSAAVLTGTGHLMFVRQGTLFAQAFDTDRQAVVGETFAITDRIAFDGSANLAAITASAAGPLAYRIGGTGRFFCIATRLRTRTGICGSCRSLAETRSRSLFPSSKRASRK